MSELNDILSLKNHDEDNEKSCLTCGSFCCACELCDCCYRINKSEAKRKIKELMMEIITSVDLYKDSAFVELEKKIREL